MLGSIPTAYIVGKLRKRTDIRQVGSRNMGAMNVFYTVGFWWGIMVLAVDIGKGMAALAIAGAGLLRGVLTYWQSYLAEFLSQRVAYDLAIPFMIAYNGSVLPFMIALRPVN
jgi:glycerol-3-phosphate acyltransferase PlsY